MTTGPGTASGASYLDRVRSSPRAQRRLFVGSLALFAIGAMALVAALFWNTGPREEAAISDEPAQVLKKQTSVALDGGAKALALKWIRATVNRKDLAWSYGVTHPDIRGTMTLKEWTSGNIPVVPYPYDDATLGSLWHVDYSYPDEALVEIGLEPAKNSPGNIEPLTFFIGLKKVGEGADAHWVVNYWSPRYKPPVPLAQ